MNTLVPDMMAVFLRPTLPPPSRIHAPDTQEWGGVSPGRLQVQRRRRWGSG